MNIRERRIAERFKQGHISRSVKQIRATTEKNPKTRGR
jgi:hypothetical protein